MLESDIRVDLPSQEDQRTPTLLDRLERVIGRDPNLGTGQNHLLISGEEVLKGVCRALNDAGVTNALAAVLNHQVCYLDEERRPDDLPDAYSAAVRQGGLGDGFEYLRIAAEHRFTGLQIIVDVEARTPVPVGVPELHARISAKVDSLAPQRGETAKEYSNRIRAFAHKYGTIEGYRVVIREFTRRLCESLRGAFPDAPVEPGEAYVRVVQVQKATMGQFRHLKWGERVEEQKYRPVPRLMERGAYSDPFIYFYWDPYYDFLNWILVDALLHEETWRTDKVRVVEPGGTLVFRGDQAKTRGHQSTGMLNAVAFDAEGGLRIAKMIPEPQRPGDPLSHRADWEPRRGV